MKPLQNEKDRACMRRLGYNIMHIRLEKGIDLSSVSKALNISIYVLKNIEVGRYLTLKIIAVIRLARYYKVGWSILLKEI